MMLPLLFGLSMVSLTLVVHVGGLGGLLAMMSGQRHRPTAGKEYLVGVASILLIMHALFFLHIFAVFAYAVLYVALGAIPRFSDAFRFSAGAYATVGSELSVTPAWRLVPAIEAANGVFLLGWSTAFFVSVIDRIRIIVDEVRLGSRSRA